MIISLTTQNQLFYYQGLAGDSSGSSILDKAVIDKRLKDIIFKLLIS